MCYLSTSSVNCSVQWPSIALPEANADRCDTSCTAVIYHRHRLLTDPLANVCSRSFLNCSNGCACTVITAADNFQADRERWTNFNEGERRKRREKKGAKWINWPGGRGAGEFHAIGIKFLLQRNIRPRCITVMEARRTPRHGPCVL